MMKVYPRYFSFKGVLLHALLMLCPIGNSVIAQEFPSEQTYYLWNLWQNEDMVVGIDNGSQLVEMQHRMHQVEQLWRIERTSDGYFFIISAIDDRDLVLTLHSYTDSYGLISYTDKTGADEQLWEIKSRESSGQYRIMNKVLGESYSLDCDSIKHGRQIALFQTGIAGGQIWIIEPTAISDITLTSVRLFKENEVIDNEFQKQYAKIIKDHLIYDGVFIVENSSFIEDVIVDFDVMIEYVKNGEVFIKKFKNGEQIQMSAL